MKKEGDLSESPWTMSYWDVTKSRSGICRSYFLSLLLTLKLPGLYLFVDAGTKTRYGKSRIKHKPGKEIKEHHQLIPTHPLANHLSKGV